jgi:signal transduction histidine kinase
VERRIRLYAAGVLGPLVSPSEEWSTDFGEILRHEVNNPLTGILGNAEMLLARRDRLPASAIERLETIAHLAVRLREIVRRLSSAAELRQADGS